MSVARGPALDGHHQPRGRPWRRAIRALVCAALLFGHVTQCAAAPAVFAAGAVETVVVGLHRADAPTRSAISADADVDANAKAKSGTVAHANTSAVADTDAGDADADADTGTQAGTADARQMLVMLHLAPPHFHPQAGYSGGYNDNAGHAARRRVAEELARRYGLTLLADWPMPVLGVDCYVMEAPAGVLPESLAPQLAGDARVAWAQPMLNYRGLGQAAGATGTPARDGARDAGPDARPDASRDPSRDASRDASRDGSRDATPDARRDVIRDTTRDPLYAAQPSAKFWHIAELHRRATGHKVSVAVIDSGIEADHPDLDGQVALRENFVDASAYRAEAHGTAVAGIIAAKAGNGVGIEGVAPGARLLALRACWETADLGTRCNSFTLAKALNFALLHDARVINMSLGGPSDLLLRRLVDVALERGVAVVAALDPRSADGGFPAAYPGVIAVGVAPGQVPGLDAVSAPGADIPSTLPGARWGLVDGTSFAAAHVAGLAALLTELRPGTPVRRDAFLDGAVLAVGGAKTAALDACATLARAAGDCVCHCGALLAEKGGHLR